MNQHALYLFAIACVTGACSSKGSAEPGPRAADAAPDANTATHTGLISVQDMTIFGAPPADHGLTVQILFMPARAPDYEELPGQLTGCKGWVYDVTRGAAPAPSDQGTVTLEGLPGGALECAFEAGSGYVCPTARGSGATTVSLGASGRAEYAIAGAGFSDADVGRYLEVRSQLGGKNSGAFPIVGMASATSVAVLNPAAEAREFAGDFRVLAGVGPVPNNPRDPIGSESVTVRLAPGGERAFAFPDVGPITPGGEFVLDTASQEALRAFPIEPRGLTLSCAGAGGSCSSAQGTIVRISTTDGDTASAPPTAMPPAARAQIEIQCGTLGGDGSLTVPAEAMALLADGHRVSPITRVRVAYMREGLGIAANTSGPPNAVRALVGHGALAFVNP